MSHPYKAFMPSKNESSHLNDRKIHLSAVEEHYFKKLLIKNQIISELNSLSPDYNDISGLRRFGPPFVPADPQIMLKNPDNGTLDQIYSISEASIDIFRNQFPLIRFIFENFIVTFPFIKLHLNKLGHTLKDQSKFWLKIQVLFELFKSKKISSSNDRGSTSKRKLIMYKFQSLFLMLFNSSIYCIQDAEYFQIDKERRGTYKKLGKFIDAAESENLKDNEKNEELAKFQLENEKKSDSYLLDMNISPESLLKHLDDIDDDEYINGYYINVVGVSIESETKSSFWGSKENKYYTFIIHVKKKSEPGWFVKRRYSDFNDLHKQLKESYPGAHVPDLPIKDKHQVQMNLDFESLDDNVKSPVIDGVDFDKFHNFGDGLADLDKEDVDALFAKSDNASPMFDSFGGSGSDSNHSTNSILKSDASANSKNSSGILKTPILGGFGKGNFKKTPVSSPISSSKKNSGGLSNRNIVKVEKSFFSSFKKSNWPSSSSSSSTTVAISLSDKTSSRARGTDLEVNHQSKVHMRKNSQESHLSQESYDSIVSSESVGTYQSAQTTSTKDISTQLSNMTINSTDQLKFPREVLRQSLRGFLRYVLYIKVCAKSLEVANFLSENTSKIELTKADIHDIQRRVNIDHLRTVQHYKFQSALVDIVKFLEKDVESLKTQIYKEGFGYVFEKIKKTKTLHELCGYDPTKPSESWLHNDVDLSVINSDTSDTSAPLRGLVRIILLEIASTEYELLIGSDSAMGTLKTIKSLHSVFPYRLIAGVLRFTNPLMMVKRLIDVFTYQMPTVYGMSGGVSAIGNGIGGMMQGLGFKSKKDTEDEKNTFVEQALNNSNNHNSHKKVGRSLLQLVFSAMLGDDLRKLEKEMIETNDLLISYDNDNNAYGEGRIVIERIEKYFESDDSTVLHIKDMSINLGIDITLAILMPSNGLKDCDDLGSDTIFNLLESFADIKKAELKEDDDKNEEEKNDVNGIKEKIKNQNENNSLYKLAKRYFFLQLRKYDKESLMELWNEPELMNVIKEIISLFLSPLIDLFKKAEVYKYVPIFARYIGELIELCGSYSNDYGQFGRSDIVAALVGLEEKYSEDVYRFIRDMYLNDVKSSESNNGEGELFEGINQWLNGIVSFLRFVKNERKDLKIDLNEMLDLLKLNRDDQMGILKNIGDVVNKAEKKRKILEKMEENGELQKKIREEEREHDWMKMARDRKVDNNWDAIHERVFKVGEKIAGEGDDEVYDMVGLDGVSTANDIDTDSDDDDQEFIGHNDDGRKEKEMKKFKDYDWNVTEFLNSYYSKDWNKRWGNALQEDYAGNSFLKGTESKNDVINAFKERVIHVLDEYSRRK